MCNIDSKTAAEKLVDDKSWEIYARLRVKVDMIPLENRLYAVLGFISMPAVVERNQQQFTTCRVKFSWKYEAKSFISDERR